MNSDQLIVFFCKFYFYTGTGSTSWTYNINKLTEQNMEEILTIVKEETGFSIKDTDPRFVEKITNKFNEMLITDAGNQFLNYDRNEKKFYYQFIE